MNRYLAALPILTAFALSSCVSSQSTETVSLDTAALRAAVPEASLPPASAGVYDLSDVDSPPVALKHATVDTLHRAHATRLVPLGTGSATVVYTISETGSVTDAVVYHATEPAYGAAATAIVKQWKFKPAEKGGRPVACRTSWSVSLDVEPKRESRPISIEPDNRGYAGRSESGSYYSRK